MGGQNGIPDAARRCWSLRPGQPHLSVPRSASSCPRVVPEGGAGVSPPGPLESSRQVKPTLSPHSLSTWAVCSAQKGAGAVLDIC